MLFKYADFFAISATLHTQKNVKESLYFDLLPGPFKSAIFFIFVHSIKNSKRKETILEIVFIFCLFT